MYTEELAGESNVPPRSFVSSTRLSSRRVGPHYLLLSGHDGVLTSGRDYEPDHAEEFPWPAFPPVVHIPVYTRIPRSLILLPPRGRATLPWSHGHTYSFPLGTSSEILLLELHLE